MSRWLLLGLGIAAALLAAILTPRQERRRSRPDPPNAIQQRARDYIASGAVPRWDP